MGNISSKDKKPDPSLSNIVNKVAAKYILTANFQDLQNLKDPNYCNKIAVLTSDIIQKNLTSKEIVYLKQKTQEGKVIDKMTKADVVYLDKNKLPGLDIQTNLQKKRVCFGIAKYYIKVAHLFSSIVGAVSPEFSYIDENNIEKRIAFKDKKLIPEKMKTKVKKINLCNRRINALLNNKNFENKDENEELTVQPRFCDINIGRKNGNNESSAQSQINPNDLNNPNDLSNPQPQNKVSTQLYSLIDEPGIPELETLYYDVYDYDSGEYKTMSEETKKKYLEDVKLFYKYFTGNDTAPEGVTRFSHITLKDYHTSKGCKPGEIYTQAYKGTIKDELFKKYADHIKMMTDKASNNQKVFFKIIDQMFIFQINNETKEKDITIHPDLNDEKLNELIDITRKSLIKLYTECEKDFEEGLKIFESIVESQVKDTLQNQVQDLEKRILKSVESPSEASGSSNQKTVIPSAEGLNPIGKESQPQIINHEKASDKIIDQQQPTEQVQQPAEQVQQPAKQQIPNKYLNIDTNLPIATSTVPPPPKGSINKEDYFKESSSEEFEYQNPTEEQLEKQYDEIEEQKILSNFELNNNASVTVNNKDGNSFFQALSNEIKTNSLSIRQEVASYLKDNYQNLTSTIDLTLFKDDINNYYNYIVKEGNYITGDAEIEAASKIYKYKIELIEDNNNDYDHYLFDEGDVSKEIFLFKLNGSQTYHNIVFNDNSDNIIIDNNKQSKINDFLDDDITDDKFISKESRPSIIPTTPSINTIKTSDKIEYDKQVQEFDYIKVPGNGTCLFYTIAYHLFGLENHSDNKNKIIDNKDNCDKALIVRKMLYKYYKNEYDNNSKDFNLDFKELIHLQYYDGKDNYLQTREKNDNKDYINTNKSVNDWIEELNPDEKVCTTNIWGNMTDLHALYMLLYEYFGISLIVYHKQYKTFYKSPFVYSEMLSGSEVLKDEFETLYKNNNTIFIVYTGDHYDVLDKKDNNFKLDKVYSDLLNQDNEYSQDVDTNEKLNDLAEDIINANKQIKLDGEEIEKTYKNMEDNLKQTINTN